MMCLFAARSSSEQTLRKVSVVGFERRTLTASRRLLRKESFSVFLLVATFNAFLDDLSTGMRLPFPNCACAPWELYLETKGCANPSLLVW